MFYATRDDAARTPPGVPMEMPNARRECAFAPRKRRRLMPPSFRCAVYAAFALALEMLRDACRLPNIRAQMPPCDEMLACAMRRCERLSEVLSRALLI